MKIESLELFEADGGWQTLSFVKVIAADGQCGWSEFNEGFATGLSSVLRGIAFGLIGRDPRDVARLALELGARARPSAGGLHAQAATALQNACLDLKARALGVPVPELFGGAVRHSMPVYWSHCGKYRMRWPDLFENDGRFVPR